jgi:hypothetical protein
LTPVACGFSGDGWKLLYPVGCACIGWKGARGGSAKGLPFWKPGCWKPVCIGCWKPVCMGCWKPVCMGCWKPVCIGCWNPVCIGICGGGDMEL